MDIIILNKSTPQGSPKWIDIRNNDQIIMYCGTETRRGTIMNNVTSAYPQPTACIMHILFSDVVGCPFML